MESEIKLPSFRDIEWWNSSMRKGDEISISHEGESGQRDLYYDGFEHIDIEGLPPQDFILFQEHKDSVGDKSQCLPIVLGDISEIISIRGEEFSPDKDFTIKPEVEKIETLPEVPENVPEETVEPQHESVQEVLSAEEKIESHNEKVVEKVVEIFHIVQNNKSHTYMEICREINDLVEYEGKDRKIDRRLHSLIMKKRKMEMKAVQRENLFIFPDGSVFTGQEDSVVQVSESMGEKDKSESMNVQKESVEKNLEESGSVKKSIPEKKVSQEFEIIEKDGKFCCPCGNSYRDEYHARWNHKKHLVKK